MHDAVTLQRTLRGVDLSIYLRRSGLALDVTG